MLTYEDALQRIVKAAPAPRLAQVVLQDALGLTLARPIVSRHDLPRFDNTAVDGYALRVADGQLNAGGIRVRVVGCAAAGRPYRRRVGPGEAVRVLTGGVIPNGADCVVMQEQVTRQGDEIVVERWPSPGQHIRRKGEDCRRGARVLDAGRRLRAQELGLLASLGYRTAPVYPRPTVAILATGDEIRPPGSALKPGQIYESNGAMLGALVRQAGATAVRLGQVRDALRPLMAKIRKGLACDVLLISGGVSVGEKDFVRAAARQCGLRPVFWRVSIKPGMPLFVGRCGRPFACGSRHSWSGRCQRGRGMPSAPALGLRRPRHRRGARLGRTLVFGLPGNPVSVFVTFEEFVKPALARLMGRAWRDGYATPATLAQDLAVSATRRTHFVWVRCHGENGHLRVAPLDGQGSHRLLSLAEADGWIRVASDAGPWPAGTRVLVKQELA